MPGSIVNGIRGRAMLSPVYVQQVEKKVKSGEYPTVATECYCGAHDDTVLTEKDRYGFPHRMVVCNECALVRANPMMTAEAYRQFYNNEYRMINHPHAPEVGGKKEDDYPVYSRIAYGKGEKLLKWLDDADIEMPATVVEIGCHVGGMLDNFKDKGAVTYGVEIDDSAREYALSKGHVVVDHLSKLIALGVKADLVIMQDVIEHYVDLKEVIDIREILSKDGYLYVWTPGLFRSNLAWYFQMAHTYQFCCRSLEYLMAELGYDAVYADEDIVSLWEYKGPFATRYNKPSDWAGYIKDHVFDKVDRKMPPFRGQCKFTKKLLHENIGTNLAMRVPDLSELTGQFGGDVIIIAGGPSIDGQVDKVRELAARGWPVITIARMLPWCIKNGIDVAYCVSVDCSEEQEKSFEIIDPDATYLFASVTRPQLMEKVAHCKRYIFDSMVNPKIQRMRAENGYDQCTVISSLGTVALTSVSVGMNLGFRRFHVFGLDLMMESPDYTHAKDIAGMSVQQHLVRVDIDGEEVLTTNSFLDFANQALDLIAIGHQDGLLESIKFYGTSIINKLWDGEWHAEEETNAESA